jgi:hypothetical protein
MAVILSFKFIKHPNIEAASPTRAVIRPITAIETTKQSHPLNKPGGGRKANIIYKKPCMQLRPLKF